MRSSGLYWLHWPLDIGNAEQRSKSKYLFQRGWMPSPIERHGKWINWASLRAKHGRRARNGADRRRRRPRETQRSCSACIIDMAILCIEMLSQYVLSRNKHRWIIWLYVNHDRTLPPKQPPPGGHAVHQGQPRGHGAGPEGWTQWRSTTRLGSRTSEAGTQDRSFGLYPSHSTRYCRCRVTVGSQAGLGQYGPPQLVRELV